ncbi:conserved exported protein of unknown function (plasmid) [Cupriavidus taiwanensis]|uniref:Copper resistance protein CopQ n=1 Tax=Cupriavidus taiwanensis TaxID=164546 RepID=A0A375IR86_9BURK|nr:hypothetical protein [Cupriavidus taiwanensis]SPK75972.1 conserved exported protein of unknown function [Cupriavidus taiwanensis]
MKTATLHIILSSFILGASSMALAPAHAQDVQSSAFAGDKYSYTFHAAKRDVFTDGAHGIKQRDPFTDGARTTKSADPFTDGANIQSPRDPFTDGAHGADAATVAGMDRTGVSAPPGHTSHAANDAAV